MHKLTTKLHRYHFDTNNPQERADYEKLQAKLKALGLECFETWGGGSHYNLKGIETQTKTVQLETSSLFNNQWNTAPFSGHSGLRVFDWAQDYPINFGKNIKQGHWLEQTPAMKSIRDNMLKCGYCGKMEPAQKGYVFCPHCLDSEYLERKDLHLLRLLPISSDYKNRKELSQAELDYLLPLYVAAQSGATSERAKARHKAKRESLEKQYKKAIKTAETEYKGFNWLLDAGLNIENCIYYSHTDRFSFGWRNPVDAEVVSAILDVISEFPFDYEIKCADGKTLSN